MYYPDHVIENVRTANNIVDVVGSRVQLNKKGKYFFGLCPFHNEKTPSFSVDPDKQYYYCYSCNKGGDVFRFLTETERLTFPEAVQRLAERANIPLPDSYDPDVNKRLARAKELQDRYFAMYADAAAFYSLALLSGAGKIARAYMKRRVIRADTARRFDLGYAYPEWDTLNKHLLEKGYTDEEQSSGGLILKSKSGGHYDRFRNRLMFPIRDAAGRVLAFGGRALDDSDVKYLNSPETTFFSKGKCLYGLHLSKTTKEKFMIVVEGYMDLITLSAGGIDNAVASLGTALTEMQARLLKRYTGEAVMAFDADAAGQSAALRGLDVLEKNGLRVRVLTIPEGKDPDDYVRLNGAGPFRELAAGAAPLVDYKITSLRRQYPKDGGDGDLSFLKGTVGILAAVDSAIERDVYATRIAAQYQISELSIRSEIEKALNAQKGADGGAGAGGSPGGVNAGNRYGVMPGSALGGAAGVAYTASQRGGGTPAGPDDAALKTDERADERKAKTDELFVVALLSIDNGLWDIVAQSLPSDFINGQNARQAMIYACDQASGGKAVTPGELMRFFSPAEADRFAELVAEGCHCEDNRRAMEQKIKDIRVNGAKRQMREILRTLDSGGLGAQEADRMRKRLTDIARSIENQSV